MIREILRMIIQSAFFKALKARSHTAFTVNSSLAPAFRAFFFIHTQSTKKEYLRFVGLEC